VFGKCVNKLYVADRDVDDFERALLREAPPPGFVEGNSMNLS